MGFFPEEDHRSGGNSDGFGVVAIFARELEGFGRDVTGSAELGGTCFAGQGGEGLGTELEFGEEGVEAGRGNFIFVEGEREVAGRLCSQFLGTLKFQGRFGLRPGGGVVGGRV